MVAFSDPKCKGLSPVFPVYPVKNLCSAGTKFFSFALYDKYRFQVYYTKCIVAPLERVEVRDMNEEFSRTLSLLRQERGVSQRTAAGALGISQALLSHYENGIREPGLAFVVRACDYYGVSADFLLGRTLTRDGTTIAPEELYDLSDEKDNSMRGSVLALLSKKLLVYKVFRRLYQANPSNNPDFFSVPARQFAAGLPEADMACSEVELCEALAGQGKDKSRMPELSHDILARDYPVLYQSMFQLVHTTGERINKIFAGRQDGK